MPSQDISASADPIVHPNPWSLPQHAEIVADWPSQWSHSGAVSALVFSHDSRWLATGAHSDWDEVLPETMIYIRDTSDFSTIFRSFKVTPGNYCAVLALAFSPDDKYIASADNHGKIEVWDIEGEECCAMYDLEQKVSINALAWSPDGKWIASGSTDARVHLWDAQANGKKMVFELPEHVGDLEAVTFVCFSPNSRWVASGTEGHRWHIWDVVAEKAVRWHAELPNFRGMMWLGDSDADDQRLVTCLEDGSVCEWSVETDGTLTKVCQSVEALSEDSAGYAAFSKDGTHILTTLRCSPSKMPLRDSSQQKLVLKGHTRQIDAVCVSPDGKYVASGSSDYTACLWRVADGTPLAINVHTAEVGLVRFSPDGDKFASGADDGTVCIRSVEGWNRSDASRCRRRERARGGWGSIYRARHSSLHVHHIFRSNNGWLTLVYQSARERQEALAEPLVGSWCVE